MAIDVGIVLRMACGQPSTARCSPTGALHLEAACSNAWWSASHLLHYVLHPSQHNLPTYHFLPAQMHIYIVNLTVEAGFLVRISAGSWARTAMRGSDETPFLCLMMLRG